MSDTSQRPSRPTGGRPDRVPIELRVVRTERLTRWMVRVVLGGDGMEDYHHNEFTDRYVKLAMVDPSADGDAARRLRTYTVRALDREAGELWIDVVQHGDVGLAGPWAARVGVGEPVRLYGPGGAYSPDPAADWHLFVGDAAAFPAIASALEVLAPGASVLAVLRAHDQEEASYLELPPHTTSRWLLDGDPTSFLDAVAALDLPAGRGHAFVHGELGDVRVVRSHLLDRGVEPELLSLSGYWRRGLVEEAFQEEKRIARP